MKITNKQENKIFTNEEEFLKFVSATGLTPHASIKGVYVGIARIAQENKAAVFTTSKSCEKSTIQEKINNLLKSTREEKFFTSWQAFKDSLDESKKEAIKEFDSKFEGNFYFVELSNLTVDSYSNYGMIQNTKSLVIFEILDSVDNTRIDLDHKEIFCIDRQFNKDTTHSKSKNGKCQDVFFEYKCNISQLLQMDNETRWYNIQKSKMDFEHELLEAIIDTKKEIEEKRIREEEEKRIREENKRKQKEAQQKAKKEAQEKEIRDSVTEGIIANILANNPKLTREQVIKMIS